MTWNSVSNTSCLNCEPHRLVFLYQIDQSFHGWLKDLNGYIFGVLSVGLRISNTFLQPNWGFALDQH